MIDIDKMFTKGNYISDYGTLFTDLQSFNSLLQTRRPALKLSKTKHFSHALFLQTQMPSKYVELIVQFIEKMVNKKTDVKWQKRLELAKGKESIQ